jgi:superfamily I DNA/RNA helicase
MNQSWWNGIQDLKDEQKKIISLPLDASHLVLGPPGSGKTNLLLLRANYFARAGHPNILILVFTRLLREFIVTGGTKYAFDTSKVLTYHKWQHDLLYAYGAHKGTQADPADVDDNSFDEQRAELNSKVLALIKRKHLQGLYDAILLDEAQDYLPEEIELLATLGKVLFIVADHRQKIYDNPDCFDALQKAAQKVHQLHYNYRCGYKICRLADSLAKDSDDYEPLAPKSQYDEASKPSSVDPFEVADVDAQAQRIVVQLATQLKAYPGELLGVVCPKKNDVLKIWGAIENSTLASQSVLQLVGQYRPFEANTRICVCTLHAAKGLEFRALHLAGCDGFKKFPNQRNLVYTAVTRAKTSLSIYHCGKIPAFLEQAIADMQPIKDLPDPKDLFGGKS